MSPLARSDFSGRWRISGREAGVGFIEVLIASVIVGIASLGIALMFGKGSAWVAAGGDNRVATRLAQQKIEQLRSLTFYCIPTGGPPPSGTGVLGATGPGTAACTTITQKYCEGVSTCARDVANGVGDWVSATSAFVAAPQPPPVPTAGVSSQIFMRKTCVQYVTETDFNSPAYTGGTNPASANCAAGTATKVKRIVVVVQPATPSGGTLQESEAPVVLEAWVTTVAGGL